MKQSRKKLYSLLARGLVASIKEQSRKHHNVSRRQLRKEIVKARLSSLEEKAPEFPSVYLSFCVENLQSPNLYQPYERPHRGAFCVLWRVSATTLTGLCLEKLREEFISAIVRQVVELKVWRKCRERYVCVFFRAERVWALLR